MWLRMLIFLAPGFVLRKCSDHRSLVTSKYSLGQNFFVSSPASCHSPNHGKPSARHRDWSLLTTTSVPCRESGDCIVFHESLLAALDCPRSMCDRTRPRHCTGHECGGTRFVAELRLRTRGAKCYLIRGLRPQPPSHRYASDTYSTNFD